MALMIDKYLAWLLVRGRGVTTFFLAPTPHEKPNENLIQTRVLFNLNVVTPLPLTKSHPP